MRYPWANTALLVLVPLAVVTGVGGVMSGSAERAWVLVAHAIAAYALVALLVFKARIVVGALRRRRLDRERAIFVAMALLLVAVLATGLAWIVLGRVLVGGISLINVHAYLAIALAAPFGVHVVARRYALRIRPSRDRGAALRLAALAALGAAAWLTESAVGRRRRFTGSYEVGADGGPFPAVSWLFDDPAPIDYASWRLQVDGAVNLNLNLTVRDLPPAAALRAILDCTGGWYSEQDWQGVAVGGLLDRAGVTERARSVEVVGVTGYRRRFSIDDARGLLLATHVGGVPLTHGHGAPLRLVAPGRRGYDWVKWVVAVTVLETDERLQSPLPLP
jgi:DMSO/TMAO reductase YedYZ molybdopterin-dependent catalytic subunit